MLVKGAPVLEAWCWFSLEGYKQEAEADGVSDGPWSTIMCQNQASITPVLLAAGWYWPGSGTFWSCLQGHTRKLKCDGVSDGPWSTIMCQKQAGIIPMLLASGWYRPGSSTFWCCLQGHTRKLKCDRVSDGAWSSCQSIMVAMMSVVWYWSGIHRDPLIVFGWWIMIGTLGHSIVFKHWKHTLIDKNWASVGLILHAYNYWAFWNISLC